MLVRGQWLVVVHEVSKGVIEANETERKKKE